MNIVEEIEILRRKNRAWENEYAPTKRECNTGEGNSFLALNRSEVGKNERMKFIDIKTRQQYIEFVFREFNIAVLEVKMKYILFQYYIIFGIRNQILFVNNIRYNI